MKTTLFTLQGQDFVLTEPARVGLMQHLKQLQRLTRFKPGVYRQNVEALRDVLLTGGAKPISKKRLDDAIGLVGLPDRKQGVETLGSRFPRATKVAEAVAIATRKIAKRVRLQPSRRLQRNTWTVIVVGSVLLATFGAYATFSTIPGLESPKTGWIMTQTSLGPVRSWVDSQNTGMAWPFDWRAALAYSILFGLVAVAALQLRVFRHRLGAGLLLFVSLCLLLSLFQTQQANRFLLATPMQVQNTKPLQPKLAYLQACGDEVPYVFDGQTSGMLFRQLRDDGYKLAAVIPTRWSDGTINTTSMCQQYDTLRSGHSKNNIVLQDYTQEADGTIRPYDFSDIDNDNVTMSYGLFVKS